MRWRVVASAASCVLLLTLLSWDAWYFDYGARANVEFCAARHGGLTVVFVFMFSEYRAHQRSDAEQILSSFSWP